MSPIEVSLVIQVSQVKAVLIHQVRQVGAAGVPQEIRAEAIGWGTPGNSSWSLLETPCKSS